tara:strand:+ start:62981 stop:66223 length:3243 start_codon:yes stop_codon:yes gene_type:complete
MALFQKSVLQKHLKLQDSQAVDKAFKKFNKYFGDLRRQQNIRESKEEQFQEGFLRELFVNVLGYTLNPEPKFNLTTELKNEKNAKKTDGAILKDGQALAVIELKSTKTKDLESIRQQAFDYKANQSGCVYVITSNFEKVRFYVNNAVDFEEFNLFALSKAQFELMYVCLECSNLLNNVALTIKTDSVVAEENITKTFYKDYSQFKRELYRDLVKQNVKNAIFRIELSKEDNEQAQKNIKRTLFKKSQKLIDRFLFVFFAEDRGLLPPNSTLKILEQWDSLKEMDAYTPLYNRYKKYFEYLDTGRKGTAKTAEIFAYNGGLFKPDAILDSIIINDELLYKHTKTLSDYDFDSQVDVNILGHIFENSLNEIESVNAEIEGGEFDKQTTKRKKDGVFYTPKYITKYIVDNTVGKLCEVKKTDLQIIAEEFHPKRQKETKKKLLETLHTYRDWLLQLTICDPACGSGAFLNQALDFLIREHQYVDELETALLGGGFVFPNIENTVLENNIFGVDLNEESVEIAKLSLWLRTAQPRRKLNSLNNNIKCGNSLIDSKAVAGDKAFKWEEEFAHVFDKGGFDVVIGNPPYVRLQNIDEQSRIYFNNNYLTAFKNYDLYVLFTEKVKFLISQNGIAAYIMPNKFITTDYGGNLKKLLYDEMFLDEYIDFSNYQVFADATTYTGIFSFSHRKKDKFKYYKVLDAESRQLNKVSFSNIPYSNLKGQKWIFLDEIASSLFLNLSNKRRLKETMTDLYVGLQTSADPVFILKVKGNQLYSKFTKKYYDFGDCEILKPLLKGAEIKRYATPRPNFKLIFPYNVDRENFDLISKEEMINKYPAIWDYLIDCRDKLEGRENGKMNNGSWYGYVYLKNMIAFDKPKILTQVLCKNSSLSLDLNGQFYFVGGGTAGGYGVTITEEINPYLLIGLLNSKLAQWYIKQFASPFQGGYYAYNKGTLGEIPLPDFRDDSEGFQTIVEQIKGQNDKRYTNRKKLEQYIISQYKLDVTPKKLQNWHELDFGEFIKELNKAIKKAGGEKLTKLDEMEWMEVFETKKEEAQKLKAEIDKTDKEIDRMVYDLYELTEAEIAIVEGA